MTVFANHLAGFTFAANSNVKKLLKKGTASDVELAMACKTTKAYKENESLAQQVDEIIIAAEINSKQPEPARTNTGRSGEPRRF